jgi:signal transduction histidine kinase
VRLPLRAAVRLGWLVVVLCTVAQEVAERPADHRVLAALLAAGAAAGWLGWAGVDPGRRRRVFVAALVVLGGCGGALAAFAPVGLAFPAVVGLAAGAACEPGAALALNAVGPAAVVVAVAAVGGPFSWMVGGVAAALAGLLAGAGRRQERRRAEQAASLAVERERADVAQARAEVLSERARLAREVHDVVAHTLGAVAVQLEALDAVLTDTGGRDEAVSISRRCRRLVLEGLADTHLGVRVLREEPVALADRLVALAEQHGARLAITGSARPLAPQAALALYRAGQEALTNAAKHAAGAEVSLLLDFGPASVALAVDNSPGVPAGPLAGTGGGHGLVGLAERVRLVGGRCSAGPSQAGWSVRVEVPA